MLLKSFFTILIVLLTILSYSNITLANSFTTISANSFVLTSLKGQRTIVLAPPEEKATSFRRVKTPTVPDMIDINQATIDDLVALRLTHKTAIALINARELMPDHRFHYLADLKHIKDVRYKKIETLFAQHKITIVG